MSFILFVTGLGTTKAYYEPLISNLGYRSHVFELNATNLKDLSIVIDDIRIKYKRLNICVCAFSIACYPVLEVTDGRTDIQLLLVDPPDVDNNPLAHLVMSLPRCVLWAWDILTPRIIKYHFLALLGNYSTPSIVDWHLSSMSLFSIRSMISDFLMVYKSRRFSDINSGNSRLVVVVRGNGSRYKDLLLPLCTQRHVVISLDADHHMIYNSPDKVADIIRRVLQADENIFLHNSIKQCLEV